MAEIKFDDETVLAKYGNYALIKDVQDGKEVFKQLRLISVDGQGLSVEKVFADEDEALKSFIGSAFENKLDKLQEVIDKKNAYNDIHIFLEDYTEDLKEKLGEYFDFSKVKEPKHFESESDLWKVLLTETDYKNIAEDVAEAKKEILDYCGNDVMYNNLELCKDKIHDYFEKNAEKLVERLNHIYRVNRDQTQGKSR